MRFEKAYTLCNMYNFMPSSFSYYGGVHEWRELIQWLFKVAGVVMIVENNALYIIKNAR